MGNETKIEYVDKTFNPWIGCAPVSPGCVNCYAMTMNTHWKWVEKWGEGCRRRTSPTSWNAVLRWDAKAGRDGVRPRLFCASLADWLDKEIWGDIARIDWFFDLLKLIYHCKNLDWLLLTKRPENWIPAIETAIAFVSGLEFGTIIENVNGYNFGVIARDDFICWLHEWRSGIAPKNVWIGATVENQEMADKRIPVLLNIPARVRYLSVEPMLGPVELAGHSAWIAPGLSEGYDWLTGETAQWSSIFGGDDMPWLRRQSSILGTKKSERKEKRIHWVVFGGETGSRARWMRPEWPHNLVNECKAANVPCFFKKWGDAMKISDKCFSQNELAKANSMFPREFPTVENGDYK